MSIFFKFAWERGRPSPGSCVGNAPWGRSGQACSSLSLFPGPEFLYFPGSSHSWPSPKAPAVFSEGASGSKIRVFFPPRGPPRGAGRHFLLVRSTEANGLFSNLSPMMCLFCLLQGKGVIFVPQLWCLLVRKTEVFRAQRKKNKLNKYKLNLQWCVKSHVRGQTRLLIFWSWWIYYVSVSLAHTTCLQWRGA